MAVHLTGPPAGAVAALRAGVDVMRLFQATLIRKPPRPGDESSEVPRHLDRNYWATSTSGRMLTAFIPFSLPAPPGRGRRVAPPPAAGGARLACGRDHLVRRDETGRTTPIRVSAR